MTGVAAVGLSLTVCKCLVGEDVSEQVIFEGAQVTLVLPLQVTRDALTHSLVLGEVRAKRGHYAAQVTRRAVLLVGLRHVLPQRRQVINLLVTKVADPGDRDTALPPQGCAVLGRPSVHLGLTRRREGESTHKAVVGITGALRSLVNFHVGADLLLS